MNKKEQLQARKREVLGKLAEIDANVKNANRPINGDESLQWDSLMRESIIIDEELKTMATNAELAKIRENENKSAMLREFFQDVRQKRAAEAAILQSKAGDNVTNTIEASGAVPLKIEDIIDTQIEGLELPKNLKMLTGVVGDDVWPFSINDFTVTEAGEVAPISAQGLDFDSIKAVSRRVAVAGAISNKAIDNAAFDLYSFVQMKIQKALAVYLASKIYSHAAWSGNKGPFSLVTPGTISLGDDAYRNILQAIAGIAKKGFTGTPVITIDKVTEYELKATPLVPGAAAGFVIQDGLLAGYPYTTSGYINKTLADGVLVDEDDRYIGIGFWDYFALQQHGDFRLTVDATSAAVAAKNETVITLNTEISMTELSVKVNGGDRTQSPKPQAFALLKIVESASSAGSN